MRGCGWFPVPCPPPNSLPLLPHRLWGSLPPWRPYRAALRRGGQEAPAGRRTGEQCFAQGEGEGALELPVTQCVPVLSHGLATSLGTSDPAGPAGSLLTSLVSCPEADPTFRGTAFQGLLGSSERLLSALRSCLGPSHHVCLPYFLASASTAPTQGHVLPSLGTGFPGFHLMPATFFPLWCSQPGPAYCGAWLWPLLHFH